MTRIGMTIESRRQIWLALSKQLDRWLAMDTHTLLNEVKSKFPAIHEATREECLKFLIMDHTSTMVGGLR